MLGRRSFIRRSMKIIMDCKFGIINRLINWRRIRQVIMGSCVHQPRHFCREYKVTNSQYQLWHDKHCLVPALWCIINFHPSPVTPMRQEFNASATRRRRCAADCFRAPGGTNVHYTGVSICARVDQLPMLGMVIPPLTGILTMGI